MNNIHKKIILYLLKNSPKTQNDILSIKRKFAKKYKIKLPTNQELLSVYRKMLKKKNQPASAHNFSRKYLESLLIKRKIRTLSGVAPIAVLTRPYPCPGNCLYCPSEKGMPKSYLSNEPAVMRAQLCGWHPFKQVALRIKALQTNGHPTDKLELIVMGGTWNYLPKKYQLWFIYNCFKAANTPQITIKNHRLTINKKIKLKAQSQINWQDLFKEQKRNEKAKHRIVGLTLETRPDQITWHEALRMRQYGCTRVEIGVQCLDNKILKLNKRGHGVKETIEATKILRNLGFKITYHMMLNLPGSNFKKDYQMFKKLFNDPNFQPDQLKIYPCVVTKDSELYTWWKQGRYKPYSSQQLKKLLEKIKKDIPYYVRIIRVIRDIPKESIIAGNKITNLRNLLNVKCKCIRCREVGHQIKTQETGDRKQNYLLASAKLFTEKYKAGNGVEYFLSYESPDREILYAFLRLRIPKNTNSKYWAANLPMVRELHTYGQMVPINDKLKTASQHRGLGKKLLIEAEKIAKKNGFGAIAVISGIGVRNYYYKLGYHPKETYLVKTIKQAKD